MANSNIGELAYGNPKLLYHLYFYLSIETPHTKMISVCGVVWLLCLFSAYDVKSCALRGNIYPAAFG